MSFVKCSVEKRERGWIMVSAYVRQTPSCQRQRTTIPLPAMMQSVAKYHIRPTPTCTSTSCWGSLGSWEFSRTSPFSGFSSRRSIESWRPTCTWSTSRSVGDYSMINGTRFVASRQHLTNYLYITGLET